MQRAELHEAAVPFELAPPGTIPHPGDYDGRAIASEGSCSLPSNGGNYTVWVGRANPPTFPIYLVDSTVSYDPALL